MPARERSVLSLGWPWLLLTVAPIPAYAQQPSTQACAIDSAMASRPDSIVLGLAAAGPDLTPSKGPPEAVQAAEAIARHFVAPSPMSLPQWALIHDSPTGGRPVQTKFFAVGHGLDEFVHLRLTADGRLADSTVDFRTASPEFNRAFIAAVQRADSAGALPKPGASLRRSGGRITLRIVDPMRATVPAHLLMTARLTVLQADENVKILALPTPAYPESARRLGVPEDIMIQYVVDRDGRVDAGERYHLLQARYQDFTEAILAVLPQARFEPARVQGCPVATMVRHPFSFRMRPR